MWLKALSHSSKSEQNSTPEICVSIGQEWMLGLLLWQLHSIVPKVPATGRGSLAVFPLENHLQVRGTYDWLHQ